MIQISNNDAEFIIRYIDEMNADKKPTGLAAYNLNRMARLLAKRLKAKTNKHGKCS